MPKTFRTYSLVGKIRAGIDRTVLGVEYTRYVKLCKLCCCSPHCKVEVQRLCSRPPQASGINLSKIGTEQRVRLLHLFTSENPAAGAKPMFEAKLDSSFFLSLKRSRSTAFQELVWLGATLQRITWKPSM